MTYRLPLTLLAAGLALQAGLARAQETPTEPSTDVELVLIQEGDRTKAFSLSIGQGAYVETQAFVSPEAIATGVMASVNPIETNERKDGFDFYTSSVATTLEP